MNRATAYVNDILDGFNRSYMYTSNSTETIEQFAQNSDVNSILEEVRQIISRNFFFDLNKNFSHYKFAGYDLGDDMLISCSFNGIECDETNFTSFINVDYGICYTYNYKNNQHNSTRNTAKIGPNYGLQLELFIGKCRMLTNRSLFFRFK